MLHGEVERDLLTALLAASQSGRAGSVVVRGEASVGKSALVDEVVGSVEGVVVLRTVGLESESPLAFAALHRLLRPVLHLRDVLPGPQVRALRVAFGEEEGAAVEPFLIAVATLTLLSEAAERTPVLCVVDDAHWLDAASADALLFAARRLGADRVAMVFCARDGNAVSFEGSATVEHRLTVVRGHGHEREPGGRRRRRPTGRARPTSTTPGNGSCVRSGEAFGGGRHLDVDPACVRRTDQARDEVCTQRRALSGPGPECSG